MSTECALKGYRWSKYCDNSTWCSPGTIICDYCGISVCCSHYTKFISDIGKQRYTSCDRCVAEDKSIMIGDQVIAPRNHMTRVQIRHCITIYNTIFTKAARK